MKSVLCHFSISEKATSSAQQSSQKPTDELDSYQGMVLVFRVIHLLGHAHASHMLKLLN